MLRDQTDLISTANDGSQDFAYYNWNFTLTLCFTSGCIKMKDNSRDGTYKQMYVPTGVCTNRCMYLQVSKDMMYRQRDIAVRPLLTAPTFRTPSSKHSMESHLGLDRRREKDTER